VDRLVIRSTGMAQRGPRTPSFTSILLHWKNSGLSFSTAPPCERQHHGGGGEGRLLIATGVLRRMAIECCTHTAQVIGGFG